MKIFGRKLTSIALLIAILFSFSLPAYASGVNLEPVEGISLWPTNVEVDGIIDTEVAYSGDCSYKIVNHTATGPMKYFILCWQAELEAGKTYVVGGEFKADGCSNVRMTLTGGEEISVSGAFGSTYDWKHAEVEVSPESSGVFQVYVQLLDKGTMWFDDLFIKEKGSNYNFVENGGFELKSREPEKTDDSNETIVGEAGEANVGTFKDYEDYQAQRDSLKAQKSFKVSDMEKFNNIGSVPLYRADGITTDASGDGWDKYAPFVMTLDRVHYVDYMNQGNDIFGEIKTAYDKDNFYIHAVVNDDKFYPLPGTDNYWKGDGVQITFSQNNVFGNEIGVAWNDDDGAPKVYSSYISGEKLDAIKAAMQITEGRQVYDVVVPWDSVFEKGRPERFQFNMCFNDNDDGTNRHDCIEIEPGILLGKAAKGCPIMFLQDDGKWLAWTEAETAGNQNSDIPGVCYLVNLSDEEKVFTIKSEILGLDENVTVPAQTGAHYDYNYRAESSGIYNYDITIASGEKSITDTYQVTVSYPEGTPEEAEELLANVKTWSAELDELYAKVQAKGYTAQYEYVDVYTMRLFIDRVAQDIGKGLYYRIGYWKETLGNLYINTKAELEKIISGEKVPVSAPVYQNSRYTTDGTVIYADTTWDGVTENRPVFFWGALAHYPLIDNAIEDMPNIGSNCVVFEYTVGTAIRDASSVNFWNNAWTSGSYAGVAERSNEEAYEGDWSFKINMTTDMAPNSYRHMHLVMNDLKPETNYTLKFYGKAVEVGSLKWGVGSTSKSISGSSDWTEYTASFKTGPEETSKSAEFIMDSKSTGFYFDNIELFETGSAENLLADREWDFEIAPEVQAEFDEKGYYINPIPLDTTRLEACEENNLSVGLLLSVAHNLPQFIYDRFPETWLRSNGFNTSSFGNDKYREIVEAYLRYMMEGIKDFTCVNYIDIANEVQMNSWSNTAYYLPRFKNWLKNKYGTVEAMNAATGTTYASFDDVKWPNGVNTEEPLSQEYDMYNDWELADFHRFCANIIHEYYPDMMVWTKIMDFTGEYGDIHMYAYYSNGTGLDAHSDVFNANGCDAYNYLDWDKGRLTKSMWYDYMVGTNEAPVFNGEDHVIKDSSFNYDSNQAYWVATDLWQGAVHYRGQTDLWLWDSREDEGITKGSLKCRPDVISETGKAGLDMNRLSYELAAIQKEKREVGMLYSDPSGLMNTSYPGCQYYAYEAAVYSGQKVNFISERQIERIHDTSVLILAQTTNVEPKTLAEIKKYIENGGKVVIIGENSLKKDWHHRENDSETVNFIYSNASFVDCESDRFKKGMTKGSTEDIYRAVNDAIEEAGIQTVKLVDAKTLEEVYDVEYESTMYDGKLIINVVNYGEKPQTLKVMVNGKDISGFTELRSGSNVDGDITCEYLKPILLSKEWDGTCFMDVIGSWAEESIDALYKKGLVSGTSATRFTPNRQITRAEFLALLMRAAGFDGKYRNQIEDVSVDAWYADNVAAALSEGIITAEAFRPNDIITREEMAELAVKVLEKKNGAVSAEESEFVDSEDIYYKDAVASAAEMGIISGFEDGSFRPKDGLTRAQAASVIQRFTEKFN